MNLLLGLALLLGNAFFVGAEFAIMSARRSQIEPRAAEGSTAAKTTLHAMEHVSLMLATCQFGITVCSLGLGAVAEPAIAHLLEPLFTLLRMPDALVHPISFAIALAAVSYLHVVVGEMVPKNIAIAIPDRSSLLLAPALVFITRIVRPIVWFLNVVANLVLRLARVEPQNEVASTYTVEQVQSIVYESHKEGLIDDGRLMTEALEFSDHQAADVMIARDSLVVLPATASPADVEHAVRKHGFSRYLVGDSSRIVGYVHVKDVLGVADDTYHRPMSAEVIRPMTDVPPEAEVEDVLRAMQRFRSHLALVVGPDGANLGVVFLEDVLEELVGEISEEILATQRGRRSHR